MRDQPDDIARRSGNLAETAFAHLRELSSYFEATNGQSVGCLGPAEQLIRCEHRLTGDQMVCDKSRFSRDT
jgi:hypothetical protein